MTPQYSGMLAANGSVPMRLASRIGTEPFAASMPEYCGVISVSPATRARLERVEKAESHFDMAILDRAFAAAAYTRIDELADESPVQSDIEVLKVPLAGSTIIDIRHPNEEELAPLEVHGEVLRIPFYELHGKAGDLDPAGSYMLYCGKGVMSRLHAGHLREEGRLDVKVYAP